MHLAATTDVLRVVTDAAATIDAVVHWVDITTTTTTPGRTLTAISTATTTPVSGSPAASTSRKIKAATLENKSAATASTVTVQFYDGTTAYNITSVLLLAGETLTMDEAGAWHHQDAQGAEYTYAGPPVANLGETGTIAETMPREICPEENSTIGASGTLFLQAIYLKAGQLVSNISIWSATTAAATTSNLFFALYDGNRNLLAQSANQGAYSWAANSKKTLAMQTAYRVTVSGVYYVGVLQVATTIATLKGGTAKTGGQLAAATPVLHGTSSTGLTTALPNPAAAITGGTATMYAAVS